MKIWDFQNFSCHIQIASRTFSEFCRLKIKYKKLLIFPKAGLEENEKIAKYINIARQLRMLWNIRVTSILKQMGTIPKR